MKIRKGFVSNSSSSSFVVFVKKEDVINCTALPLWLRDHKFEDHNLWTFMRGGSDGDWFLNEIFSKKILDIILDNLDQCANIGVLIDPEIKDEEDFSFGFNLFDPDFKQAVIEQEQLGKIYEVMSVDYHGLNTSYDWLYHFGKLTDDEYWKGGLYKTNEERDK